MMSIGRDGVGFAPDGVVSKVSVLKQQEVLSLVHDDSH
jgi:hypothetical protein